MTEEEDLWNEDRVGDYKPGSITRIKLKNFLTHENIECRPGPRLNVAVGANGTGKSTILNAFCLGLGGSPKILGRADDARAFIMHGKSKAEIEIELAPVENGETHTFRRVIDRNKGSEKGNGRGASTFYINDKKAKEKDVQEMVTTVYNITIDNLCTFLPQDKVGSFSGYGPKEILIETEKTLSASQHHYKAHQELIQLEEKLAKGAGDVDSKKAQLQRLERDLGGLEREKERIEEREKAIEHQDLLEKKKLWLEFDSLQAQAVEEKKEKTEMKAKLREKHAELQPLQKKHERLSSKKKEMETAFKSLDQRTQRCQKELGKQSTKYEHHDDQAETILSELREIDSKRGKLEADVDKAKEKVALMQDQWNSLPSIESVDEDYKQATAKCKEVQREYNSAKREVRNKMAQLHMLEETSEKAQRKLAKMEDEASRRRDHIFRQHPNLRKIYQWLEDNRGEFRRRVWGPIACEVTPKTANTAAYLEQHVPNGLLKSFVVETKEDYDKLYDMVRRKMKIPINIVVIENGRLKPLNKKLYSDEKMAILKREHGVLGFLDEAFNAPDPIREALRSQGGVHRTLVGNEQTQESVDKSSLLDFLSEPDPALGQTKPQACTIFTNKGDKSFKYTQMISRYSNTPFMRQDEIMPARMLTRGVDQRAKKLAEEELDRAHRQIDDFRPGLQDAQKKQDELEAEAQEASAQASAAKNSKDDVAKLNVKLSNAKRKLRDAESALGTNNDEEKRELAKSLMNYVSQSLSALESHSKQQRLMIQSTIENAGVNINSRCLVAAEQQARSTLEEKHQEFSQLEEEAKRVHETFIKTRQRLKKKKEEADREAPILDADGNDLPLKEKLEDIDAANLHEVEAALEEAELKVNGIVADPNVLRQYELRKAEIEKAKSELEEMTSFEESTTASINFKRKHWETTLNNSVAKVNTLFNKYMSDMGFVGEVRLRSAASEDGKAQNFKDWGIEILVSFRDNARFQVLSAQFHSGGERSVSTILYLMALQDMMVAPFRCVDEINQGLDERNERLVFQRIVNNTTQPPKDDNPTAHSGQYFLITPKLLPNLVGMASHGITLMVVLNGSYNYMTAKGWDIGTWLRFVAEQEASSDAEEQDDDNGHDIRQTSAKKRRTIEFEETNADDPDENAENAVVPPRKSRRSSRDADKGRGDDSGRDTRQASVKKRRTIIEGEETDEDDPDEIAEYAVVHQRKSGRSSRDADNGKGDDSGRDTRQTSAKKRRTIEGEETDEDVADENAENAVVPQRKSGRSSRDADNGKGDDSGRDFRQTSAKKRRTIEGEETDEDVPDENAENAAVAPRRNSKRRSRDAYKGKPTSRRTKKNRRALETADV